MKLYRERLPATHSDAPELVMVHGWASSSDCWRGALPLLRKHFHITLLDLPGHGASRGDVETPDELMDALLPLVPPQAIYLGWSLGAMLVTRFAASHPDRVVAVISLAANASFVAREHWPWAMPEAVFEDFCQRFERHTERGLRRFDLLQWQGDDNSPGHLSSSSVSSIGSARRLLQCLGEWDNRPQLKAIQRPHLFILGENDALVPQSCVGELSELNTNIEVQLVVGAGHISFFSQADTVWAMVLDFCRRHQLIDNSCPHNSLNKRNVADSFSRAAESYDSVAALQRRVADMLFTKLSDSIGQAQQRRMLDLGCGTGYSLPALRPVAEHLVALDLAEGMLRYTRDHPQRRADSFICGDAEDLPLHDESVDCVFSSLSIQWCENIAAVFSELYRVLKPGGRALLSTLGPTTLHELRGAWQAVDARSHVNRFLDADTVQAGLNASGLRLVCWDEQEEVLHYHDIRELTAELKQLGAHNVNAGRPGGLTGKQALRGFVAAYESYRKADGLLPASYQLWYLTLEKPEVMRG